MSLAILTSRALYGFEAQAVRVEVHVGSGLPSFIIVGLPDTGVRESRERVRSALLSCGFEFPAGRITVNLAPADIPKDSGRFDLAIALGVLLASRQVRRKGAKSGKASEPELVLVGELSLTGALSSIRGALLLAMSVANSHPGGTLIMPPESAAIAAQVPNIKVLSATTLHDVVDHIAGRAVLPVAVATTGGVETESAPCLSDVVGASAGRRAVEVAAAGGHSLLFCGPPGVGKSMLAHRLPGLLPALEPMQSLEVAALHGLTGRDTFPSRTPPFRSPHHTASTAALIGGGAYPRPGEISLAHHGVLFLDEAPEFQRPVLEALREPLETGSVSIARARRSCSFPAQFQLLAAMNPCPCGWAGHPRRECTCTPSRVLQYRQRLSGPMLDRIDLHVWLAAPTGTSNDEVVGEPSIVVKSRVDACRRRQYERQGCTNARLAGNALQQHAALCTSAARLLREASQRWAWSGRAVHRVQRVARTLADMADRDDIRGEHVAEALQFRPAWSGN